MLRPTAFITLLAITLLVTACGPGNLPAQKIGKPYVVNGENYYPSYEANYDKTGTASWYGPGFHGKYTASGEVYDQNDLTAAHPTLPMPSLVRVTNLENGKSAIVRINDRGPFAGNRLIDLSKKSAQTLGIRSLAQVRVQFLEQETQEYIAMAKAKGGKIIPMSQYEHEVVEYRTAQQINNAPQPDLNPPQQPNDDFIATNTNAVASPVITVSQEDIGSREVMRVETPIVAKPVIIAEPQMKKTAPRLFVQEAMADEVPPAPAPESDVIINENDTITERAPSAGSTAAAAYVPEKTTKALVPQSTGKYTIQAGVFSSEQNAQKLVSKLQSVGETSVEQVQLGGKTLWRVRLGGFAQRDYADETLAQVRAYVPDAKVVRK
jgi:rare lipoprotein A